ncbi:hypothetical protein MAR_038369 [Mya arenaria]|uniref:Uncharacterized protein n=1 Tax=Mya arenaria TaxID=6604 RepID=A0ABY7FR58_MYAAR|nr:hypothetical protein MAR_038369 [Mya arenaria]
MVSEPEDDPLIEHKKQGPPTCPCLIQLTGDTQVQELLGHVVPGKMELCAPLEIIKSILLVVFSLHSVRTERGFNYLSVEERCIEDCNFLSSIPNVTFNCDGDNSSCDWQCAAQRMGCDVGLIYHCAHYLRHHDVNLNQMENIETCAPEEFCNAGEEPYVTFFADGAVGSHKNATIKCLPCKNPNFYNSRAGQSSASYSRCYQLKVNKCIPEAHKIDCGDISWRTRKETDGLCRCDAGHAPANESVNTTCFNSYEICVPKTCPQLNQELLSVKCKKQPESRVHEQTLTKESLTIWYSVGLLEGTENCTAARATGGSSPYSQEAATGTRSQAYDQHRIYGSDTLPFHQPQPGFSCIQPILNQGIARYEENHLSETSCHTTTVMIEKRDENAFMNTGSPSNGADGSAVAENETPL